MATHTGLEGIVKIGANAIAKITSWNFTESANAIPDNAIDDAWENNKGGRKKWAGSLNCNWDPADANGQELLSVGSTVTLDLYGNGEASGDTKWAGDALITEAQRDWSDESMVTVAISFVGDGVLTKSTIA